MNESRKQDLKRQEEQQRALVYRYMKKLQRLSVARLLLSLVAIAAIIGSIEERTVSLILLAVVCVAGFLILVLFYRGENRKLDFARARERVLVRYDHRYTGKWHHFKENGIEFQTEEFPPGQDLHVYGRRSLFQYINVAGTQEGKRALAKALRGAARDDILLRREAVRELSKKETFSIDIQTYTELMTMDQKKSDQVIVDFLKDLEKRKRTLPTVLRIGKFLLPLITACAVVATVTGFLHPERGIPAILCFIGLQAILSLDLYLKRSEKLTPVYAFSKAVDQYRKIFECILDETFAASLLTELQGTLRDDGVFHQMRKLRWIQYAWEFRRNELFYLVASVLFLWDYHLIDAYDDWRFQYGSSVRAWVEAVGELEVLLSLAVLCDIKKEYTFPVLLEGEEPVLQFEEIKHPLLPEDTFVGNDFETRAGTILITGSNMSGKTTFLRSVGLNLILAYAGAPAAARSFTASRMQIYTSLGVQDDVSEGISTFYAEILRIKEMNEAAKKGKTMICLIDEIFKGTNAADRTVGAIETIRRLSTPTSLLMITTHDFGLCDLEETGHAKNYHFDEGYEGDRLIFDYKIKDGRCRTTNARFLLRMAGISVEDERTKQE